MKISDADYIVFDLETTGLSPWQGSRVIEIGAVRIESGKLTDTFQSLVNPLVSVPEFLSEINGITDTMIKDQPVPGAVFPKFLSFINNAVLVAHNAKFDLSFLRAELALQGLSISNRHQCTLQKSRRMYPELPNYPVPHTRGDEPTGKMRYTDNVIVFPTHVGMNRTWRYLYLDYSSVPHTRGDEPRELVDGRRPISCSPQKFGGVREILTYPPSFPQRYIPRKARIGTPGALQHIIIRGTERKKIYRNAMDKKGFKCVLERFSWNLYSTNSPGLEC